MSYFPAGLLIGIIISLIAILILLALVIPKWRAKAEELFTRYITKPMREKREAKLLEEQKKLAQAIADVAQSFDDDF